jgi:hypothetical protein
MAELLCDMDYVKAEYARAALRGSSSAPCFRISLRAGSKELGTFEINVNDSAHFVAELDVLVALIRARTLKAQLSGED